MPSGPGDELLRGSPVAPVEDPYLPGGEQPYGAALAFDTARVAFLGDLVRQDIAERVTDEARWAGEAMRAFSWFHGQNHLQHSLYDPSTGGCRDGLHADRPNQNQGAESTLAVISTLQQAQRLSAVLQ